VKPSKVKEEKNKEVLVSIEEIVSSLTGDKSLDYLCCFYDVSYSDIVNHPGVRLVYK
jgi:hypothetical protein